MRKAFDYQQQILDWSVDRRNVALFLEMRLGKTLVAIRWANLRKANRVLVVSPVPVIPVWLEELKMEGITGSNIKGYSDPDLSVRGPLWATISYESLLKNSWVQNQNWDAILLDESTRIRNPRAKITKVCRKLKADNRAVLSGLPAPESLMDYFCQMAFLRPDSGFMGCKTYWQWRMRFFQQGFTEWDWVPRKNTAEKIHSELDRRAYVLRRHQVGMGSKKVKQCRYVELPAKMRKAYNEAESTFCLNGEETQWVLVMQNWLHRLAGGFFMDMESDHKTKELMYLLTGDLSDQKVVVWFRFNKELHRCYQECIKKKIKAEWITGKTKEQDRISKIKSFQESDTRVLLCQMACLRYGVNLSSGSAAIYFSNSWEFELRSQSEDRIIHPSKKEPALLIDLVTKDTIDEDLVNARRVKNANATSYINKVVEQTKIRLGLIK
jgi:SNF2 family DNA or RNA helicase